MTRVLLDEDLPVRLRHHFPEGVQVETVEYRGWKGLRNGALLGFAAKAFDVFVTTDKNLQYQQNVAGRRLAILVLPTTSWPVIRTHVTQVVAAVNEVRAGELRELSFSE